jgi:hypothetical protein
MPAKRDLRIIVRSETRTYDPDYVIFTANICYVNQETEHYSSHEIGALLNPMRTWGDEDIAHLADLTIRAQKSSSDAGGQFYGFDLGYDSPHRVELRELETMVKGLRCITRKMDKLAERFGRPTDLGTFCAHVADAIGCTDSRPFGEYRREPWIDGQNYRWGDVETLRTWIDKF